MQATKIKKLSNFLKIFTITILVGYFFMQAFPIEQRGVDAGLVLAELVIYPDQISPLKEYYFKSWTLIHQISKLFLNLDWSFLNVSKLIIFIISISYFLGIFFIVNESTKMFSMAILIAVMTLILQKNFGDTDYPSMIFSEHTYGALSLATVTLIFGLLFLKNMFFAGLFIALLISIHPLIGVWINGVILLTILINKYYFKFSFNYNSFFKGFLTGVFLSIISFFYNYISAPEFNSYFNLLAYENYMKYWEGHRTFSGYHLEYLIKTFTLFVCCLFSLILIENYLPNNSKFGFLCITVSILISSIFYFIYKIFYLYIPDSIKLIIPSRFIIMHSVIGWPLILTIFFLFIKKLEKKYNFSKNVAYIFIISIILIYSTLHYKTFNKVKESFLANSIKQNTNYDDSFWSSVRNEKFDGYIVTSYSSSLITIRKGLKPIMLDVTSFDFVPYFPNTAKSLAMIIENIYGIKFSNPPAEIRNSALLNDETVKLVFERHSKSKWNKLSYDFNIGAILVPVDWKINLEPHIKNKNFAFYIL